MILLLLLTPLYRLSGVGAPMTYPSLYETAGGFEVLVSHYQHFSNPLQCFTESAELSSKSTSSPVPAEAAETKACNAFKSFTAGEGAEVKDVSEE
ncbi:unnamed protein product [Caenorhabditis auriculariae]|uniref:Uncharacterized protein n=1 Tax=Caenorhabditis auriculariae TaxID=2777116 RepID=A0A8S1HXG3_9PELO|nr:unnamed protein product [Caenorhabditis auriculariae]